MLFNLFLLYVPTWYQHTEPYVCQTLPYGPPTAQPNFGYLYQCFIIYRHNCDTVTSSSNLWSFCQQFCRLTCKVVLWFPPFVFRHFKRSPHSTATAVQPATYNISNVPRTPQLLLFSLQLTTFQTFPALYSNCCSACNLQHFKRSPHSTATAVQPATYNISNVPRAPQQLLFSLQLTTFQTFPALHSNCCSACNLQHFML